MNQIQKMSQTFRASRLSATNVMPAKFKWAFDEMDPSIAEMTEIELEQHFRRTTNDFLLRQRLWEIVPQAEMEGRQLTVDEWCSGIVESPYIHQNLIKNPYRLSWIFTPLLPGHERYAEIFDILMTKLKNTALNMNINDDNIGSAIRFLENVTNRVLGPVPKNINLKAQSIPSPQNHGLTSDEIDERLRQLETAKDVTPELKDE